MCVLVVIDGDIFFSTCRATWASWGEMIHCQEMTERVAGDLLVSGEKRGSFVATRLNVVWLCACVHACMRAGGRACVEGVRGLSLCVLCVCVCMHADNFL